MATRWHYRIHGRDIGPVDFATLQTMAREERLFAEDEIRSEDSDQWVTAQSVPGLFEDSGSDSEMADEDDLSSMLASAEPTTPSDTDKATRDGWYCRTRTDELGPMPFGRMLGLARNGKLAKRDQVRQGVQGSWVEARSIEGLFEEPAPAAPVDGPAATPANAESDVVVLDGFEIVPDTTPEKPKPPRPKAEPILKMDDEGRSAASIPDTEAEWTCRVLGQEIGPITWDDMRELVETRQIGPNDRVRKAHSVAWVPAGTISDLFPKRKKKKRPVQKKRKKYSDDDVLDFLQPDEEPEEEEDEGEEYSSHLAPQRAFARTPPKSSPAMPARPQAGDPASAPANRPSPAAAPTPPASAAPPPSPAAPGSAPPPAPKPDLAAAMAAAAAHRPGTAPPPPRPAPKREKRKMGNPLEGLGERLEDFQELLASGWKPLAGVIAALLLVVAGIYGGASMFSSSTRPIYEETVKMWDLAETYRMSENREGWNSFKDRYSDRSSDFATQLEQEGSSDPLAQLLLTCHRDLLPKMLEAPITGASDTWAEMEQTMEQAKSLHGE